MSADPGSSRAKRAFDKCTKKLCEKLNELDRWVADSVVDQVTDVFVEPSQPLQHLVQAATAGTPPQGVVPAPPTKQATSTPKSAPPPTSAHHSGQQPPDSGVSHRQPLAKDEVAAPSNPDTRHMAEIFRRHSHRLSQVAVYAAQSSTDTESKFLCGHLTGHAC